MTASATKYLPFWNLVSNVASNSSFSTTGKALTAATVLITFPRVAKNQHGLLTVIATGLAPATNYQVKIQSSPDNSTWTDVSAPNGGLLSEKFTFAGASTDGVFLYDFSLEHCQDYVRAVVVTGGTGTANVAVTSIRPDFSFSLGHPFIQPATVSNTQTFNGV
jgi:hypothetical protein